MKKEEITTEQILEICKLYKKYLGGHLIDDYIRNPEGELEELINEVKEFGNTDYYRIGSIYEFHTKFGFMIDDVGNISPKVNLNFAPKERKGPIYEEAQKTVELFLKESIKYLSQQNKES